MGAIKQIMIDRMNRKREDPSANKTYKGIRNCENCLNNYPVKCGESKGDKDSCEYFWPKQND